MNAETRHFLATGEIEMAWAAVNDSPAVAVNASLAGPNTAGDLEGVDIFERNVLLGRPQAYAWRCERCGDVLAVSKCPKPECRHADTKRIVIKREAPVEYGPMVRSERRLLSPDRCNVCGQSFDHDPKASCPNEQCRSNSTDPRRRVEMDIARGGKVMAKVPAEMRLSELRRACPDRTERLRREKAKIVGHVSADKLFLLAR